LPSITPKIVKESSGKHPAYERDGNFARNWILPGTPELMHRLGSLEKDFETGEVSQDSANHERMVKLREEKVQKVAYGIPELVAEVREEGDVLLVGWGSTYGHLKSATDVLNSLGVDAGLAHFNYIKPLSRNTADILSKFKKIVVCELNQGQFVNYLRMLHPTYAYEQYNKSQGLPFTVAEIVSHVTKLLG